MFTEVGSPSHKFVQVTVFCVITIALANKYFYFLWKYVVVLIRNASSEYPQHKFSLRNKKNISNYWSKKVPNLELCRIL